MLKLQLWRLHGSVLGPLCGNYECVDCYFCGTPNSGSGVPRTLSQLWESFSYWLASHRLDLRYMPSLTVTGCAVFRWCPWEACSSLKGNGGGVDLGEHGRRGRAGRGEESGTCRWNKLYERRSKKGKRKGAPAPGVPSHQEIP